MIASNLLSNSKFFIRIDFGWLDELEWECLFELMYMALPLVIPFQLNAVPYCHVYRF